MDNVQLFRKLQHQLMKYDHFSNPNLYGLVNKAF